MLGSVYALSTIFIQIYEGGKGKNGSTVAVSSIYFQVFHCIPPGAVRTCKCLTLTCFGVASNRGHKYDFKVFYSQDFVVFFGESGARNFLFPKYLVRASF